MMLFYALATIQNRGWGTRPATTPTPVPDTELSLAPLIEAVQELDSRLTALEIQLAEFEARPWASYGVQFAEQCFRKSVSGQPEVDYLDLLGDEQARRGLVVSRIRPLATGAQG